MKSVKNSKIRALVALSAGTLLASSALAASYHDYAKVTAVEPIYQTVRQEVPREQCWNERVQVSDNHYRGGHQRSSTPTLVGALVGGALGNELGHHKRNKQVGAVVGALLGGSIGRDIQRQHHREQYRGHGQHVSYRTEQHCETVYETETEQQLVGYQVDYKYRGHFYQTETARHPGERLRVQVAVTPVE